MGRFLQPAATECCLSPSCTHLQSAQKIVLVPMRYFHRIVLDVVGRSCFAWGLVADVGRSHATCSQGICAGWKELAMRDRLMKPKELAERLRTSTDWVYRHWQELPFTVKLSPRQLRFSEKGLEQYLEQRQKTESNMSLRRGFSNGRELVDTVLIQRRGVGNIQRPSQG